MSSLSKPRPELPWMSIRAGEGPFFLECRTYRFRAHSMFDPQLYREKSEVEEEKTHGPILRFSNWLKETGMLHDGDLEQLESEIARDVAEAVAFAEAGTWEAEDSLLKHVYASAEAGS